MDERGWFNPDEATVLECCGFLKQVKSAKKDWDDNSPVFELVNKDKKGIYHNQLLLGALKDIN